MREDLAAIVATLSVAEMDELKTLLEFRSRKLEDVGQKSDSSVNILWQAACQVLSSHNISPPTSLAMYLNGKSATKVSRKEIHEVASFLLGFILQSSSMTMMDMYYKRTLSAIVLDCIFMQMKARESNLTMTSLLRHVRASAASATDAMFPGYIDSGYLHLAVPRRRA